jgi:hypothetical protein
MVRCNAIFMLFSHFMMMGLKEGFIHPYRVLPPNPKAIEICVRSSAEGARQLTDLPAVRARFRINIHNLQRVVRMPEFGDELHHFSWNACSSAFYPYAPHPHVERRHLVVPRLGSSRLYIIHLHRNAQGTTA